MKAIDNKELILSLEELEKERGIKKVILLEAIETALVTAYKRDFDSTADNAKVVVDKETGDYHVFVEKEVVEKVEDGNVQISLDDAKKINKSLEIGDTAQIEIMPKNFGRIAKLNFCIIISERRDNYGNWQKYFKIEKEEWSFTRRIRRKS